MKHLLFPFLLVAISIASAQETTPSLWSFGLRGGWTSTTISRYDGGRMDEVYSSRSGIEVGIQSRYEVNSWLALRANLSFMQRSHRMDRNLNYINPVFTEHINSYLMLPMMADFSFGGDYLRGHLFAGAFVGYWLTEQRRGKTYWMTDYYVYFEDFDERRDFTSEDNRLNFGLSLGASLSYSLSSKVGIAIDAIYYYDLTSHHIGSPHLADPRYLNTISLSLSVNYKL